MAVVTCALQGRFGSCCQQYLFARAYAEKFGHEFQCAPWLGDRVFDLHDAPLSANNLTRVDEHTAGGRGDVIIWSYGSSQACMIYTKAQAQAWLNIKQDLLFILERIVPRYTQAHGWDTIVGHQRKGDYIGHGYPVVNMESYHRAAVKVAKELNLGPPRLVMVTEENPLPHWGLHDHLSFLPDFFRLLRAPVLLRGNSSFSWTAGLLSNGVVYSPVIDKGAVGGVENDVEFVAGNHPRICCHPGVDDLRTPI